MARRINLYNKDLERKRERLNLTLVVVSGLVLLLLTVSAGFVVRMNTPQLQEQERALNEQLQQITVQREQLQPASNSEEQKAEIERNTMVMRAALSVGARVLNKLDALSGVNGDSFAENLRGFSRQVTPGVWLTAIEVDNDKGRMEIHGRAVDSSLLPKYIRRLNNEVAFRGRAFASLDVRHVSKEEQASVNGQADDKAQGVESSPMAYLEFSLIPFEVGADADKIAVDKAVEEGDKIAMGGAPRAAQPSSAPGLGELASEAASDVASDAAGEAARALVKNALTTAPATAAGGI